MSSVDLYTETYKHYDKDDQQAVAFPTTVALGQVAKYRINKNNDAILDTAAGTGKFIADLKRLFPDAEYTAGDLSDKMIEICQKRNPGVKTLVEDCTKLGQHFSAESFDLLLNHLTLTYLEDHEAFFKMTHSLLRDEGAFSIVSGIRAAYSNCKQLIAEFPNPTLREQLVSVTANDLHVPETVESCCDLLEKTGFKVLEHHLVERELIFNEFDDFVRYFQEQGWGLQYMDVIGKQMEQVKASFPADLFPLQPLYD
ncbi:MAG: class I SAM-dependent methyltransferase [Verrucomicrobiota bacterium]